MSVSIANTTSQVSGKTVVIAENDQTVTGLHTFSRSTSAPFAVGSGSAVVSNLDADKLDGQDGSYYTNATNLASGTVPEARLASGTGTVNKVLRGNSTWGDAPGVTTDGSSAITQLTFAATQSASSNANTLDDYEEGSWTPVLGGSGGTSGQSYTTQVGRYVKVGKLVFVQGYALLSTKGTITTNAQVQGLPFPVENTTGENTAASIRLEASATALVSVSASAAPNTSVINIVGKTGAATSSSPLVAGDIGNTTEVTISMVYRTDN